MSTRDWGEGYQNHGNDDACPSERTDINKKRKKTIFRDDKKKDCSTLNKGAELPPNGKPNTTTRG